MCAKLRSHHSPVDRADTRNILRRTNAFRQQTVADFPRKHGRIFLLVARYGVDNWRRCHFRFRSTDDSRLDRSCLIEPVPWQHCTFTYIWCKIPRLQRTQPWALCSRACSFNMTIFLGCLLAVPDVTTHLLTASVPTNSIVRCIAQTKYLCATCYYNIVASR